MYVKPVVIGIDMGVLLTKNASKGKEKTNISSASNPMFPRLLLTIPRDFSITCKLSFPNQLCHFALYSSSYFPILIPLLFSFFSWSLFEQEIPISCPDFLAENLDVVEHKGHIFLVWGGPLKKKDMTLL